jgi:hypothetical protein
VKDSHRSIMCMKRNSQNTILDLENSAMSTQDSHHHVCEFNTWNSVVKDLGISLMCTQRVTSPPIGLLKDMKAKPSTRREKTQIASHTCRKLHARIIMSIEPVFFLGALCEAFAPNLLFFGS